MGRTSSTQTPMTMTDQRMIYDRHRFVCMLLCTNLFVVSFMYLRVSLFLSVCMMCLCLPFLGISIFLGRLRLRLRQRLYFNHFYNLLCDFILNRCCRLVVSHMAQ